MTHDLVIRNGVVVDGTGGARFAADVAVDGRKITQVGVVDGTGHREIDAEGQIVSPGWVDIHTHYDGQATWDRDLAPSSTHGVTSIVMGNCGVGFAPARPDKHDWLISLLEGVEDIPGTALTEGMKWGWEIVPRVSRRARRHVMDTRRWYSDSSCRAANLCHGRRWCRQHGCSHPRPDRSHVAAVRAGHSCRRAWIHDLAHLGAPHQRRCTDRHAEGRR